MPGRSCYLVDPDKKEVATTIKGKAESDSCLQIQKSKVYGLH